MDLENIGNAIKDVDSTLRNIVPIAGHVVNKVRRNTGGWGFDAMLMTPISDYCLIDMADWQMRKSMFLSLAEKNITLDLIGDSVSGITHKISDEVYKYDYSYAQENNYINNYQREAQYTTTREGKTDNNEQNYKNHNQLYGTSVNVYPDDDDTGNNLFTEDAKWETYEANRNRNSIIYKTKQLFRDRKINTIISRFHTDPEKLDLYDGTEAKSVYGLSHGRNLLTYDAERNGISYDRNGYDNPYCRVWTHHHQYSQQRSRLIRPFTIEDENGNVTEMKTSDFHSWNDFGDIKYEARDTLKDDESVNNKKSETSNKEIWGWKDSGKDGWQMSVLNKDTGLVNIAPKFLGGAEKNIHTKDCMFSIENLAWQGYDPYSFERALSWEQRGPFGGRIMWFPPYGLRFSEDTSVNWNEHSFIGRGENVYTYTNTSRSGTLEFMMVVDHPSIIDYATWHNPKNLKDTDVLRFFAGCGVGNDSVSVGTNVNENGEIGGGGSLLTFVKPTPLTDEYIKKDITPEAKKVTENKPIPPPPPQQEEIPAPDEEIELSFYVFYPNNYSGYYDKDSKVNPIAYLLYGKGAQWKCNDSDVTKSEVLPLDFKETSNSQFVGNGYEMRNSGSDVASQNASKNYIIGTQPNWRYYKSSKYIPYKEKKWYYRTDGEYKVASGTEQYKNTFDQTLLTKKSYQDSRTLHLNCNVQNVKSQFPSEKNNDKLYSLAEIAYALKHNYENENASETADQIRIKNNSDSLDSDRIKELVEMFDTRETSPYKIIEIHGIGYSNSHGNNAVKEINRKRNDFLAEQRCKTAINWFLVNYGKGSTSIQTGSEISTPSVAVNKQDLQDESGDSAKRWRSAKIKIKIKKSTVLKPKDMKQEAETSQEETQEPKPFKRFDDFDEVEVKDGVQLYVLVNEQDPDKKGRRWYYDEKTSEMKVWNPEYNVLGRWTQYDNWTSEDKKNMPLDIENANENSLRYDQEYYFFKQLHATHPAIFDSLVEKLQYFDPAFHSMTPEGFMGRLNFLQQCTRQGDTIAASDKNGHSANNLAFGRPPFCILRLGDFYYQKIVIRNINITYDPLVLDLNNEGIGVVPLIANVTISFNFIGGGDLSGPVRRLQNAMSFNYYANGRLYDNRADRIKREDTNWETMGAMGNDKVKFDSSYFHHVRMANNK